MSNNVIVNQNLAEALESEDMDSINAAVKDISGKRMFTQYRMEGNDYVASPPVHFERGIAPGFYELINMRDGLHISPRSMTTDNLLRFPDSASDMVIAEIEKFWNLKNKFYSLGFVHKRGFLLHGAPGCGKTSTIAFLTKQMIQKGGVVIMGDTHPGFITTALRQIRDVSPDTPVMVLMEDIDTIISNYGESDVLSLLDGENSVDNVVYVATTNYLNRLQDRVAKRPSRFDMVVEVGFPGAEAREMYLASKQLGFDEQTMKKWVDSTSNFPISHLKELIISVICLENDFNKEVERMRSMLHISLDTTTDYQTPATPKRELAYPDLFEDGDVDS